MTDPDKVCSRCGVSYPSDVIFCPKDGTPLGARRTEVVDDPYVDLTVAGQFRIEQLIGIGAMGRVYRAHQSGIDRAVAIKILHRELLRNPTVIARFHREAKVASRLVHPNVVQMLMTGELDRVGPDVGGEAYLVMEFLDGISLRSALAASGGAMPFPRALHVLLQVCDAVGEAHAQGIVHRDLKPENVMLVKRGDDSDFVKVLDFGVARLDWAESSMATQAGVIFGTARYISPEGAQGVQVGAPSDVYSLATMLFQCLSGETPFDGDSSVAILLKHTSTPAPDLRSRHRSSYVPEPIARVIAANLAKDPADRCRDARELGRALLEAARGSGLSPDDLMVRSTLVTGARGALGLASIERTKTLDLSPGLAEKLAVGSARPEKTVIDRAGDSGPLHDRPSSVDPTLSDEPADRLSSPRISTAPAPVSRASYPSSVPLSGPVRPSFPDSEGWRPADSGSSLRRWVLIFACFALGAALTAIIAHRLGAFAGRESGAESYALRARAALLAGAWDSPPGENVKDITDAALRRWPGADRVIAVRRDGAEAALLRAVELRDTDRVRATELAGLAVELDPDSERARALVAELALPPPGAPSAAGSAPAAAAALTSSQRAPRARVPRFSPPASGPPKPKPAPSPQAPGAPPAPTQGGGRWL